MKKIGEIYNKIEEYALVGSLAVTVVIVFFQVVMRYIFNQSLSWSEELCRYIFIWQVWFGASIAFRRDEHISINIIKDKLKGTALYIYTQIANILTLLFNIFFMVYGFKLVGQLKVRGSISSGIKAPLYIVYLCVPLSALVILFRITSMMIKEHKDYNTNENYGKDGGTAENIVESAGVESSKKGVDE